MLRNDGAWGHELAVKKDLMRAISPAWLTLPAAGGLGRPPTQSQIQLLPFDELTWENFERLCYRLARLKGDVEGWVALYGSRGQKQDGIDLYIRRQGAEKYSCWQSKRKKLSAPGVRSAVAEFEAGEWWAKSDQFCICTSSSIQDVNVQGEIERQRTRLEAKGIDLQVWGQTELSTELKDNNTLVRDFFGRTWGAHFCTALDASDQPDQLDADDIAQLRCELRTLYSSNFSTLDPGIVGSVVGEIANQELPLLRRFVEPDVEMVTASAGMGGTLAPRPETENTTKTSDVSAPSAGRDTASKSEDSVRLSVSAWVAAGDNALLTAEGGLGKSTCLRAFALDQLGDGARFPAIAKRWPDAIPIFIPFAFWVRLFEEDEANASLASAVETWLRKFDASQRLLDLLAKALAEGRGLLLIDGLDEWVNETAARSTVALLNTFIRSHSAPAIATGRPAGLSRLGVLDPIWRRGRLATLSEGQQKALATIWLNHFEASRPEGNEEAGPGLGGAVQSRVTSFFGELALAGALVALAGTPLLLSGLISLHLRQLALPRSRFQAYEELVELLLEVHPTRRAQAALDRAPRYRVMVDAQMRKEALALFAFEKRKQGYDAGCPVGIATRIVSTHLESLDGAGLARADAVLGAKELVTVGPEATGLIVERAPQEVGFIHAIFEEALAGFHLASLPIAEQIAFVQLNAGDARWSTCILAMLHSFSRPSDVEQVVKAIHGAAVEPAQVPAQKAIIAEAVFGDFKCTPRLTRDLSSSFFVEVAQDGWFPYRQRLLRNIVEASASGRSSPEVKAHAAAWFPDPENYRHSLYRALRTWPEDEALDALFLGLYNDLRFNKTVAAEQIVARFRGDAEVGKRLLALCHSVAEPQTVAAAMEAYMDGWEDNEALALLIEAASSSADPDIRLTGVRGKIKLGTHSDEDLDFLLWLAKSQNAVLGESALLAQTLVAGWPRNDKILNICWAAFEQFGTRREISLDLARHYLLVSALTGADIDQRLSELIETHEHFFSLGFSGGYVGSGFGPRTRSAIDTRLGNMNEHLHNDIAHLAVMSRSDAARQRLIDLLDSDTRWAFWPVYGLLEGWGMSDAAAAQALAKVAAWPPSQLQNVAHHLPQLISDKVECRRRLLEIAALPQVERPDFLVIGFRRSGIGTEDVEVVDALLPIAKSNKGLFAAVGELILGFGSDPRVRDIAKQHLHSIDCPWPQLFEAYGDDHEMRAELTPYLRSLGTRLRGEMVTTMEGRAIGDNAFVQSLSRYSLESDAEVRSAASIAYHEAICDQPSAKASALERLATEIRAVGPQMDAVRQAAFAGLVALNSLHVLTTLPESERKWPIGHSAFALGRNRKFFGYLARRWDRIGSDEAAILNLFGFEDRERWYFWDRMAPYIRQSDFCRSAFLDYCRQETKAISTAALEALAQELPASELLRHQCFRHTEANSSDFNASPHENRHREFVAGRLIGSHFGGETEMQRRVESLSDIFLSTKIAACSTAWADAPFLKREFDQVVAGVKIHFGWVDVAFLASAVGDDDAFTAMLLKMINRVHGTIWDFLTLAVEPVVKRLINSPNALDQLRDHLSNQPSCSDVASVPRLMSQADGLDTDTRRWTEAVVRREMSGERMPSFGMDISAGRVRPVALAVLDAIVPL